MREIDCQEFTGGHTVIDSFSTEPTGLLTIVLVLLSIMLQFALSLKFWTVFLMTLF